MLAMSWELRKADVVMQFALSHPWNISGTRPLLFMLHTKAFHLYIVYRLCHDVRIWGLL